MTPALVRWGGLAGSVATAVTAYLGGAGAVRRPSVNPVTLLGGDLGVVLPVCWVLGTAVLVVCWWTGRRLVPSTRWALVTAGLWFLPVLPFLPLGSADIYSYACQGWVQQAGGDPYSGGLQQSGCPWLSSVDQVWRESPAPYGPLFLQLAGWAAAAGGTLAGTLGGLRVIALAGLALTAAGLPALARRAGVDPARAVWTVLACPLVLVHLVSGAHNDALMIGLIVAGLAVVDRSPARLVTAGVLLGLAVSVKATAIVVVPFAVLAAAPAGSQLRALWRPALAIGGGLVAVTVLMSVVSGRGLGWVAGLLRSGDTVAWTSPSTAVGLTVEMMARLGGADVAAIGVTRVLGIVVLAAVLVLLLVRARKSRALAGAGLALAAVVLCAPVFHPWYATWPLAVLAATVPDTTPAARWLLGLCAFAATLTTPAGYNWALYTRMPGALAVTAAVIVGAVMLLRRIARPREAADTG